MFEVELLKAEDVAKMFGTTHSKIKAAILNGTLPIGFVAQHDVGRGCDRVIIVKRRLDAWINAKDLGAK